MKYSCSLMALILVACGAPVWAQEASVRPGINDNYQAPAVDQWAPENAVVVGIQTGYYPSNIMQYVAWLSVLKLVEQHVPQLKQPIRLLFPELPD